MTKWLAFGAPVGLFLTGCLEAPAFKGGDGGDVTPVGDFGAGGSGGDALVGGDAGGQIRSDAEGLGGHGGVGGGSGAGGAPQPCSDADGDGAWPNTAGCNAEYPGSNWDCEDSRSGVHPGADEVCNVVDDDCDGQIDEGSCSTECDGGNTTPCNACPAGTMVPPGWVCAPAGAFMMGSPVGELGRNANETQHQVTLTRSFLVKATETTQAEWRALMGSNPSNLADCGGNCPVENVNWNAAVDYCNALSQQQGLEPCYDAVRNFLGLDCQGYRLPTEAEWEYAARAGTTTAFYTGGITNTVCGPVDPNLDAAGWYCGNSMDTHPVASPSKTPNDWGLYDMLGNVFEWTGDWYSEYPSVEVTDPAGPPSGDARVGRGGGWFYVAEAARSAYREREIPGYERDYLGFRAVRTVR